MLQPCVLLPPARNRALHDHTCLFLFRTSLPCPPCLSFPSFTFHAPASHTLPLHAPAPHASALCYPTLYTPALHDCASHAYGWHSDAPASQPVFSHAPASHSVALRQRFSQCTSTTSTSSKRSFDQSEAAFGKALVIQQSSLELLFLCQKASRYFVYLVLFTTAVACKHAMPSLPSIPV